MLKLWEEIYYIQHQYIMSWATIAMWNKKELGVDTVTEINKDGVFDNEALWLV